jgi:preprotein translocase subunit SecA
VAADLEHNRAYQDLMKLVDKVRVLKIRTNADTPHDAAQAVRAQTGGAKQPAKVAGKKVGRNDPCPCGSGKKYKHCCGR